MITKFNQSFAGVRMMVLAGITSLSTVIGVSGAQALDIGGSIGSGANRGSIGGSIGGGNGVSGGGSANSPDRSYRQR